MKSFAIVALGTATMVSGQEQLGGIGRMLQSSRGTTRGSGTSGREEQESGSDSRNSSGQQNSNSGSAQQNTSSGSGRQNTSSGSGRQNTSSGQQTNTQDQRDSSHTNGQWSQGHDTGSSGMRRNTSGMGQHQSRDHCEPLKVTKMLFDLVFMAEQNKHMGQRQEGGHSQGGQRQGGQRQGQGNHMGQRDGDRRRDQEGYGHEDEDWDYDHDRSMSGERRGERMHSGERDHEGMRGNRGMSGERMHSGDREGMRKGEHSGEGKQMEKKEVKINFMKLFAEMDEDLTAEERFEELRKRDDFEHILKAVKMRAYNQFAKQHHHGQKEGGHNKKMMMPKSPADLYAKAFNKDLMFIDTSNQETSEVPNPKHGMEEFQKMKKWARQLKQHQMEKQMWRDEPMYEGRDSRRGNRDHSGERTHSGERMYEDEGRWEEEEHNEERNHRGRNLQDRTRSTRNTGDSEEKPEIENTRARGEEEEKPEGEGKPEGKPEDSEESDDEHTREMGKPEEKPDNSTGHGTGMDWEDREYEEGKMYTMGNQTRGHEDNHRGNGTQGDHGETYNYGCEGSGEDCAHHSGPAGQGNHQGNKGQLNIMAVDKDMLWEYFLQKNGMDDCLPDHMRSQMGNVGDFLGQGTYMYRSDFLQTMEQFFNGEMQHRREGTEGGQRQGNHQNTDQGSHGEGSQGQNDRSEGSGERREGGSDDRREGSGDREGFGDRREGGMDDRSTGDRDSGSRRNGGRRLDGHGSPEATHYGGEEGEDYDGVMEGEWEEHPESEHSEKPESYYAALDRDECEIEWQEWKHGDEEPIAHTVTDKNCREIYQEYEQDIHEHVDPTHCYRVHIGHYGNEKWIEGATRIACPEDTRRMENMMLKKEQRQNIKDALHLVEEHELDVTEFPTNPKKHVEPETITMVHFQVPTVQVGSEQRYTTVMVPEKMIAIPDSFGCATQECAQAVVQCFHDEKEEHKQMKKAKAMEKMAALKEKVAMRRQQRKEEEEAHTEEPEEEHEDDMEHTEGEEMPEGEEHTDEAEHTEEMAEGEKPTGDEDMGDGKPTGDEDTGEGNSGEEEEELEPIEEGTCEWYAKNMVIAKINAYYDHLAQQAQFQDDVEEWFARVQAAADSEGLEFEIPNWVSQEHFGLNLNSDKIIEGMEEHEEEHEEFADFDNLEMDELEDEDLDEFMDALDEAEEESEDHPLGEN